MTSTELINLRAALKPGVRDSQRITTPGVCRPIGGADAHFDAAFSDSQMPSCGSCVGI